MASGGAVGDYLSRVADNFAPERITNKLARAEADQKLGSMDALQQLISGLTGNAPSQTITPDAGVNGGPMKLDGLKLSTQSIPSLPPSVSSGQMVTPQNVLPELKFDASAVPGLNVNGGSRPNPLIGSAGANALTGGVSPLSGLADFMNTKAASLAMKADPQGTLEALQKRLNPAPIGKLGKDESYYGAPGVGGKAPMLASNMVPDTFKTGATRDIQRGGNNVTQEYDGTRWNDIGSGPKFKPDEGGGWTVMSPDQIKQANLEPTGTYQVNGKGQVQVITQPKQNNPTEAQQKYAYNARRLADAMGAVSAALKKSPDAVSSGALEATQDSEVPGVAYAGRAVTTPEQQIVHNNLGDAIDAALTLGTGAAYNTEQLAAARASLLPKAGESPTVKADKFRKMQVLYDQAKTNAHSAGIDLPDPSIFANIYGQKPGPGAGKAGAQPPGPAPIGRNGKPMKWVAD